MPRWLAVVIVVAVVASLTTLGAIPVWQHWETTPARRTLTWVGLIGMPIIGLAVVALLIFYHRHNQGGL